MALATVKDLATELNERLPSIRKQVKGNNPLKSAFKKFSITVGRYLEAVGNLRKCLNLDIVAKTSTSSLDLGAHQTTLENISRSLDKPVKASSLKRHTNEVDELFEQIVKVVAEGNSWIKSIRHGITENEGKVWWLSSFGEEEEVEWDDFWLFFQGYMGTVYGFKSHEGLDKGATIYQMMERGVRMCFGKGDVEDTDDVEITMKEFEDFYARFGPWNTLYHKSLTMCDLFGEPKPWFLPTTNSKQVTKYFTKRSNKNRLFIIRYSNQPGKFVWQNRKSKILIHNSSRGYSVKADKKNHKNIADVSTVLETAWNEPPDPESHRWRESLDTIDRAKDQSGYEVLADEEKQQTETEKMNDKLDKIINKVDDLHKDLLQIGMRLLTSLESTMPRLFFLIPEKMPDGTTLFDSVKKKVKQQFQTTWRVFILCEGDHFMTEHDTDGQNEDEKEFSGCHFTKHEGFPITLPKASFVEHIPHIRIALKLASIAIAVGSSGLVNLGPVTDYLQEEMENIDICGILGEMEGQLGDMQELFDETAELPEDTSQVLENYKILRTLLFDDWLGDGILADAECAELKLMWHKGTGKQVWVCNEHRGGLVGLDDKYEAKHEYTKNILPDPEPVATGRKKAKNPDGTRRMSLSDFMMEPTSTILRVKVHKAKGLWNVDRGFGTSINKSDPYCVVIPKDETGRKLPKKETNLIKNDLDPVWNTEWFEWQPKRVVESIEFEIWDWNRVAKHISLGKCEVLVGNEQLSLQSIEMKLKGTVKRKSAKGSVFVSVELSFDVK